MTSRFIRQDPLVKLRHDIAFAKMDARRDAEERERERNAPPPPEPTESEKRATSTAAMAALDLTGPIKLEDKLKQKEVDERWVTETERCVKRDTGKDIKVEIDWETVNASENPRKVVYTIHFSYSPYVLHPIEKAVEALVKYDAGKSELIAKTKTIVVRQDSKASTVQVKYEGDQKLIISANMDAGRVSMLNVDVLQNAIEEAILSQDQLNNRPAVVVARLEAERIAAIKAKSEAERAATLARLAAEEAAKDRQFAEERAAQKERERVADAKAAADKAATQSALDAKNKAKQDEWQAKEDARKAAQVQDEKRRADEHAESVAKSQASSQRQAESLKKVAEIQARMQAMSMEFQAEMMAMGTDASIPLAERGPRMMVASSLFQAKMAAVQAEIQVASQWS